MELFLIQSIFSFSSVDFLSIDCLYAGSKWENHTPSVSHVRPYWRFPVHFWTFPIRVTGKNLVLPPTLNWHTYEPDINRIISLMVIYRALFAFVSGFVSFLVFLMLRCLDPAVNKQTFGYFNISLLNGVVLSSDFSLHIASLGILFCGFDICIMVCEELKNKPRAACLHWSVGWQLLPQIICALSEEWIYGKRLAEVLHPVTSTKLHMPIAVFCHHVN